MKMITAIVNKEDAKSVTRALIEEGFSITRLSTTGGYLRTGNATILTGVEEEKVQEAIGEGMPIKTKIVKRKSTKSDRMVYSFA